MITRAMLFAVFMCLSIDCAARTSSELTISGKIAAYTDATRKVFTFNENSIRRLPVRTIKTFTNWTTIKVFTGVPLTELLKYVGALGKEVEIRCLDGYRVTIPLSDLKRYGVILAYEIDGEPMSLGVRGPYAVIYPVSDRPRELSGVDISAKTAWYVSEMVVR